MKSKNNQFEAIVVDLDGTLLPKTKEISVSCLNYLIQLQKQGIHLIIATGRNPKEVKEIIQQLQLEQYGSFMICCNGQLIHDFTTQQDYEFARVKKEDALDMCKLAKKMKVMISIDNDEALYQTANASGLLHLAYRFSKEIRNTKWVFNQLKTRNIHKLNHIEKAVNKDLRKICFSGAHARLEKLAKTIEHNYSGQYVTLFVADTWLEVMDSSVSKGHAMEMISTKLELSLDSFLAFGDGENDITLLQKAGWGVAMENAMDSVKAIADDIAGKNDDDGIFHYCQTLNFKQQNKQ